MSDEREYDYVVVGAGSAGCVMAARLTEDPSVSVLLLEAGPIDGAPEIEMPLAFGGLFRSRYDWDFCSEPEPGLGGRLIPVSRGKVVGGSSSINGMCYTRGIRSDYDDWARNGATGWSYDEVLPYFKRSEDNERGADEYHGVGGPLTISDARSQHQLSDVFLEAAGEAGHRANPDFNGATQEGVGYYQVFMRDGRRCSNAKAFLHPALARPNLTLLTDAHVLRVELDGTTATGVEVLRHGRTTSYAAAQEVIVCGGAIQSPHLLMHSGIGPAAELARFGIRAVVDLPVGQGFQDHTGWLLSFRTNRESLLETAFSPENVALFEQQGSGPLTSSMNEAGGFMRSSDDSEIADMQMYCLPLLYGGGTTDPEPGITLAGYPTKARTRGSIALRNGDPLGKPRILHNYLSHPDDLRVLRDCVRRALEITDQPALRSVITEPFFGPTSRSDEDLDAFVRQFATPTYHQAGSCPIGPVVDPELRVHGVQRLRVVDASVMPDLNRGNTNAPATMIAEKAADLVRGIGVDEGQRRAELAKVAA